MDLLSESSVSYYFIPESTFWMGKLLNRNEQEDTKNFQINLEKFRITKPNESKEKEEDQFLEVFDFAKISEKKNLMNQMTKKRSCKRCGKIFNFLDGMGRFGCFFHPGKVTLKMCEGHIFLPKYDCCDGFAYGPCGLDVQKIPVYNKRGCVPCDHTDVVFDPFDYRDSFFIFMKESQIESSLPRSRIVEDEGGIQIIPRVDFPVLLEKFKIIKYYFDYDEQLKMLIDDFKLKSLNFSKTKKLMEEKKSNIIERKEIETSKPTGTVIGNFWMQLKKEFFDETEGESESDIKNSIPKTFSDDNNKKDDKTSFNEQTFQGKSFGNQLLEEDFYPEKLFKPITKIEKKEIKLPSLLIKGNTKKRADISEMEYISVDHIDSFEDPFDIYLKKKKKK